MFGFHSHRHLQMRLGHHHGRDFGSRGPKMFEAGALRYIVLQLIAEQPRHGYEIIKDIEQRTGGGYAPSPGVIYPLLSMLEDLGHVVVTQDSNKKLHTITPEGQAFLDENRGFVKAIFARMSRSGRERGTHCGRDIKHSLHALKAAVVSKARGEALSEEQLQKIQAILERAANDVQKVGG
jgi:DNA-binding PadR family transcriptional regulator